VLVFWIASEALTGWGLSRREKGSPNDPKRPRDPNQLAKSIIYIATGQKPEIDPDEGKDAAAVALGRKGGLKAAQHEPRR
jgi:hypothetical protein